jgi:2-polyprenyl-3-methyl-5-hydroxy-6-metoxy-1,4-benzoquinol methylase
MMSDGRPGVVAEVASLDPVREKKFKTICALIKQEFLSAVTVLDVGCSQGVFLKITRETGFMLTGLEPDARLAENCRMQDYEAFDGSFPDVEVISRKQYDVIIFNDSFEHIPHLQLVIESIKKHLHPLEGLVINLPTSNDFLFWTTLFLSKFGIRAPLNRLWQKGFALPYLHYFNARNLRLLFEQQGFVLKRNAPLCYYIMNGLWSRISCKSSFGVSVVSYLALALLYPLFRARNDCFAACFSAADAQEPS